LCGALIVYQTDFDGQHHELGTSGFLYRSNKLMYDHATESLWSTLQGEPVVGPLVGKKIQLNQRPVVTTTWGDWKNQHPNSTVLSLDTGYRRDYGEGAAYRDYFATDELMFELATQDTRLKNKDEVLVLRTADEEIAISADFLLRNKVHMDKLGEQQFVVLTNRTGANRVYETDGVNFKSWNQMDSVLDDQDHTWSVSEDELTDATGKKLQRLPAHRAFWFGWQAQYPDTRLVK